MKFYLPFAHPEDSLPGAEKIDHLNTLLGVITTDSQPFSLYHLIRVFSLQGIAANLGFYDRTTAMWSGSLARITQSGIAEFAELADMFVLEMDQRTAFTLKRLWPSDIPMPTRIIFGPIDLDSGIQYRFEHAAGPSIHVQAGEKIGTLDGTDVKLGFEGDFHFMDAEWVLRLIQTLGLWQLPESAPVPFASADSRPAIRFSGRPDEKQPTRYLVISTERSGYQHEYHYPPFDVFTRARRFTFLSSSDIHIRVALLPDTAAATLTVTDKTAGVSGRAPFVKTSTNGAFVFKPDAHMPPTVKPFLGGATGNGSVEPARELRYAIRVTTSMGGLEGHLACKIRQDLIDRVRQEYRNHQPPMQTRTVGAIPPRALFRKPLGGSKNDRMSGPGLRTDNYYNDDETGDLYRVPNADGLKRAAEYIRRRYHYHSFEAIAPHPEDEWHTADLEVVRAWVNPERNERLGFAIDDPNQFGFALELAPFHFYADSTRTMQIVRLKDAGLDFMQSIKNHNNGLAFDDLSVSAFAHEDDTDYELWRWTPGSMPDGAVGSGFTTILGDILPVMDDDLGYPMTTSIRVVWQPRDLLAEPVYPAVDPYPALPAANQFTNLVIFAEEDDSVPENHRAAIDDVAESLLRYLNRHETTKNDHNRKIPVGDPARFLKEIGAARGAPMKVRYLFTISHGWPGYIVLTNYDEDEPVAQPPRMRSAAAEVRLRTIYGDKLIDAPGNPHRFTTFCLHAGNLDVLPDDIKRRLRHVFSHSDGVFLLGCSTNNDEDLALAKKMSQLLDRTVYGATELTRILARDQNMNWGVSPDIRDQPPFRESIVLPQRAGSSFMKNPLVPAEQIQHIDHVAIYKYFLKAVTAAAKSGGTP